MAIHAFAFCCQVIFRSWINCMFSTVLCLMCFLLHFNERNRHLNLEKTIVTENCDLSSMQKKKHDFFQNRATLTLLVHIFHAEYRHHNRRWAVLYRNQKWVLYYRARQCAILKLTLHFMHIRFLQRNDRDSQPGWDQAFSSLVLHYVSTL